MDLRKDDHGNVVFSSFPSSSSYVDNGNYNSVNNWAWKRIDGLKKFSFDSEAEREWCDVLKNLAEDGLARSVNVAKEIEPNLFDDQNVETKLLWGKNFLEMSDVKFEYYSNGIHASYPDFIMEDCEGRIHLFEVKSLNSSSMQIDSEAYQDKVRELKECYKHASVKTGHIFYLPVLDGDIWHITRFVNGIETNLTEIKMKDEFLTC